VDGNVVVGRAGRGVVDAEVGSFFGSDGRVRGLAGNYVPFGFRQLIGEYLIDDVVFNDSLPEESFVAVFVSEDVGAGTVSARLIFSLLV